MLTRRIVVLLTLALSGVLSSAAVRAEEAPPPAGRLERLWTPNGGMPVRASDERIELGGFLTIEGETIPPPQGRTHVVFKQADATFVTSAKLTASLRAHAIATFGADSTLFNELQGERKYTGVATSARVDTFWGELTLAPRHIVRAGYLLAPFGLANRDRFSVQRLAITQPVLFQQGYLARLRGVEANGSLAEDWSYHAYVAAISRIETIMLGARLVYRLRGPVDSALGVSFQRQPPTTAGGVVPRSSHSWGADTRTSWRDFGIQAELVGSSSRFESFYMEPYWKWNRLWALFSRYERAYFSLQNDNTAQDRDRVVVGVDHFIEGNPRRRLKLEFDENLFRIPRGDENLLRTYFLIAGQLALEF